MSADDIVALIVAVRSPPTSCVPCSSGRTCDRCPLGQLAVLVGVLAVTTPVPGGYLARVYAGGSHLGTGSSDRLNASCTGLYVSARIENSGGRPTQRACWRSRWSLCCSSTSFSGLRACCR